MVFVHGIGSQKPGETLLDWSRPIIKVLREWRQGHGHPPDPVVATRIDFAGARIPIIELDIPAIGPRAHDNDEHAPQRWLLTEAWWAASVAPPSVGTMVRWLVRDMGRVVDAIRNGLNRRAAHARSPRELTRELAAEPTRLSATDDRSPWARPDVRVSPWISGLDRVQAKAVGVLIGFLWLGAGTLMVPYSLLRSLPLVGDRVAIAQLDGFLVNWFGDLRVLLHDPAQAANIRGRLAEAMTDLRDVYDCGSIVIVAHSGGVIVSLTTLSDRAFALDEDGRPFPVKKLITIGQGMSLGWRLWEAWVHRLPPGDRLAESPFAFYPELRWLDFNGTYDPAPAGPFDRPDYVAWGPVVSQPIWNRMSLREDHGTYWENDEEFLIPLLQELDTPKGLPTATRFFRGRANQVRRLVRRTERVAVLGLWRWLVAFSAFLTIALAWAHPITSADSRLADIGRFADAEFANLPGHEVMSGPLDALAAIGHQIGGVPFLGRLLAIAGLVGVLAVIVLVPTAVLGWLGAWRWLSKRLAQRSGPGDLVGDAPGFFGFFGLLDRLGWPKWLPHWLALALLLMLPSGLALSEPARAFAHGLWTPGSGDLLVGGLLVALLFVAIEVVGASRWEGWDSRERWEARQRHVRRPDRWRIWAQAALLLLLLLVVFFLVALASFNDAGLHIWT